MSMKNDSDLTNSSDSFTRTVVFRRQSGWIPYVIQLDNKLYIELGAGADANHEPRTFRIPITQEHLSVIEKDLTRHLLLWSALLPLCDAAGTKDPLDQTTATALLDPILFAPPKEVELLFTKIPWQSAQLIARHTDVTLLEQGELFSALEPATLEADWNLAAEYNANRERVKRGVTLSDLDAAILKYTGQYLYRSGIPSRKPDQVDPNLLPQVLEVIKVAEMARQNLQLPIEWGAGEFNKAHKDEWHRVSNTIEESVRSKFPELVDDAIETIAFLMCSEVAAQGRQATTQASN